MSRWPIFDKTSKVFPLYSRANVGEVFPDPISPLNASLGFQATLEPGWRDAFVACGVWDHDLYDTDAPFNIIPAFGSYLYINMSLMRVFGVRVPGMSAEAVDLQYFGDMPGIPPYESEKRDFDEDPSYSEKVGAWLQEEVLLRTDLHEFDADRSVAEKIRAERPSIDSLSDAELVERLRSFRGVLVLLMQHHIESSLKAGVGLGAVAQLTGELGRPELALRLVAGIGDVDSAVPSVAMWHLSRKARGGSVATLFDEGISGLHERLRQSDDPAVVDFRTDLDGFLSDWDFRGPSEWELRAMTWSLKPEIALSAIDTMRRVDDAQSPEAKNADRVGERKDAVAALRALVAGDEELAGRLEVVLTASALWLRGRERSRMTAAMVMHEIRLPARELGRRFTAAGHLESADQFFMLYDDEIDRFLTEPDTFTETLREREHGYLEMFDLIPPFVIAGEAPSVETWTRRDSHTAEKAVAGEQLTGVPGCTGAIRGRARVLLDPSDPSAIEPGDILVAPITDPSWTPLFVSASAVVANVGGPHSHAAIVSRELGIPCVVSVTDATNRIPDGALIEVDGTTGTVTVLEI